MRVLHIITSLGNGGAEAILFHLVTRSSQIEHHVVSLAGPDWYSAPLAESGVPVHHIGVNSAREALKLLKLVPLLRRSGADVVQTWMHRANLVGGLAAKLAGLPVVWGIHSSSTSIMSPAARRWVHAGGAAAGWIPGCVINCSARSASIMGPLGFGRAPVKVIHNGYSGGVFYPDDTRGSRFREANGIAADAFLLGTVARWDPHKDHANLISALAVLRERQDWDFRCLFVGPGVVPENAELMQLLRAAGIERHVICAGTRSDIPDVMRALDLHVLPSADEAFPNAVAEAMLSGTPSVVTDVGDAAYMVGETGWVAPPKAPTDLAERIAAAEWEFRNDPAAWSERTVAARARVTENFSLEKMAQEYASVWRAVAAGQACAAPAIG